MDQIIHEVSTANGAGLLSVIQVFFGGLWRWMTVRGDSTLAVGGLAVSVSMTYLVQTIIGFWYLNRAAEVKLISWNSTIKPIFIKILNAAIMSLGMYFVFKIFDLQLDTTKTIWVIILTGVTCIYGLISYLLGSYLFKIKEYYKVKKFLMSQVKDLTKLLKRLDG